jgi:hypothetical protein
MGARYEIQVRNTIALTLAAVVPAAAQTNYYNGWQQQPGYTYTRPNQAPMYDIPNGVGGYMTQTPGQSPMYGIQNGVGGYGVGGGPAPVPPGYINRQGR